MFYKSGCSFVHCGVEWGDARPPAVFKFRQNKWDVLKETPCCVINVVVCGWFHATCIFGQIQVHVTYTNKVYTEHGDFIHRWETEREELFSPPESQHFHQWSRAMQSHPITSTHNRSSHSLFRLPRRQRSKACEVEQWLGIIYLFTS